MMLRALSSDGSAPSAFRHQMQKIATAIPPNSAHLTT